MNEVCSHFLNSALLICNVIRMIADESWKTILPTQAHFHERWKTSFSVFWLRNPLNVLVLEEWEKSNGMLSLRYGHIFFTFWFLKYLCVGFELVYQWLISGIKLCMCRVWIGMIWQWRRFQHHSFPKFDMRWMSAIFQKSSPIKCLLSLHVLRQTWVTSFLK